MDSVDLLLSLPAGDTGRFREDLLSFMIELLLADRSRPGRPSTTASLSSFFSPGEGDRDPGIHDRLASDASESDTFLYVSELGFKNLELGLLVVSVLLDSFSTISSVFSVSCNDCLDEGIHDCGRFIVALLFPTLPVLDSGLGIVLSSRSIASLSLVLWFRSSFEKEKDVSKSVPKSNEGTSKVGRLGRLLVLVDRLWEDAARVDWAGKFSGEWEW